MALTPGSQNSWNFVLRSWSKPAQYTIGFVVICIEVVDGGCNSPGEQGEGKEWRGQNRILISCKLPELPGAEEPRERLRRSSTERRRNWRERWQGNRGIRGQNVTGKPKQWVVKILGWSASRLWGSLTAAIGGAGSPRGKRYLGKASRRKWHSSWVLKDEKDLTSGGELSQQMIQQVEKSRV